MKSDFGAAVLGFAGVSVLNWFFKPREHETIMRTAIHEAGHVAVILDSPALTKIEKVSIKPGLDSEGTTVAYFDKKNPVQTYERIILKLGGFVAEHLFLQEPSAAGCADDLDGAVLLAQEVVSDVKKTTTAPVILEASTGRQIDFEKYVPEHMKPKLTHDVQEILNLAFAQGIERVQKHKDFVRRLVPDLIKSGSLNEKQINSVLKGSKNGR